MSRSFLCLCFLSLLLVSCKSEYEKVVTEELATGVIYEDLIFGLKFGQTKKEFYAICWDLNKQKVITHGPKNNYVKYMIKPDEMPSDTSKIEMLFYGIFDNENIMRGLDKRFCYSSWALWNKAYHSDKLQPSVKEYYMNLYGGNEFITIDLKMDSLKGYVKVDGNRQIVVYPHGTKEVGVKIQDTRYLESQAKLE